MNHHLLQLETYYTRIFKVFLAHYVGSTVIIMFAVEIHSALAKKADFAWEMKKGADFPLPSTVYSFEVGNDHVF